MVQVNIRVNSDLNESVSVPFEFGTDPFYSEKNMKILRESIRDADAGKLTEHDLME